MPHSYIQRSEKFAAEIGLKYPILLGPMAGASPVSLSVAVAKGGGMGACGALMMQPESIKQWAADFRAQTDRPFQLNLWIRDAAPLRDPDHETRLRGFLSGWGPEVSADAGNDTRPDFKMQCEALLEITPTAISSIMGVFDARFVERMKAKNIRWFANVSTVTEAIEAEAAGADVIVAKSFEAGGHSGAFKPEDALRCGVGMLSLVPAIADTVALPIVATGGIAESTIEPAWSDAIGKARPEHTIVTRAFTGRAARSIATKYALAMEHADSPEPAPYPVQRGLTQSMQAAAAQENRIDSMQAWAGQSASMAQTKSATEITQDIWNSVRGS